MKASNSDFLGRGWSFPPSFDSQDKQIEMVSDNEDIRQSLAILLSTEPGERLMHPTYGCGLHQVVFETVSTTMELEVKDLVTRAILFFEPRITLLNISVDSSPEQYLEGRINIHLDYVIRSTNTRSNMVFPFYINEGTEL